jgi:hypothetical protein
MEIIINGETSDGVPLPINLINSIEDELSSFFKDKFYGQGVEKIYSGFICVSDIYEKFALVRPPKLLRKESALDLEYKLDFYKYRAMNDYERRIYILQEFLKTISEFNKIKTINKFNFVEFVKDLEEFIALPNSRS